jgi:hypothetical protein
MTTNGSDTNVKEDFSLWFICGSGADTFVGKISESEKLTERLQSAGRMEPGKNATLSPCYKYTTHMMQIPQQDSMGRIVGYGLAMQEMVSTPTGIGKDVSMTISVSWVINHSKEVEENIARLAKIARDQQVAMRSAAAGIQTAGRIRL